MSDLINLFKEFSEKKQGNIYYYANNGNAGDALINMGFYALAKKYNLNFKPIAFDEVAKVKQGDTVMIAGGGALVPEWGATTDFLTQLNNQKVKVVILPHSIREVDDVISNLTEGSIIFCREKYSYDYCIKKSNASKVFLEDDIAFFCDVSEIKSSKNEMQVFSSKNIIRKFIFAYHNIISKFKKTIYATRVDKEQSATVDVPRVLVNDLSIVASFGSSNYDQSLYSARKFLELIDLYDEVYTDRLHVSIGAALLNKKVKIYNNGYYKCKGVYEQSMKKMENVSFIE
ncbi:polysaccharide pyruvyl transferase family protein [Acinetobacter oleivorans]|uniref:polysaccharide pyruvyl transferase family protein n=1 Tax=Acinetobacter oleivorans TaxID=1148157 RepID=UPI000DD05CDC|nr:polysaccharide pyruvyl transferase family protein [Acinetobacter oleivorans]